MEAKELLATSATLEKSGELVVDSKTEVETASEVDISVLSFVRLSEPD
ncbi:hypothetical protein LMG9449_2328 [Lactococcus lactis subsp. lactis]|uniref:Uncharacterized protein n=2 Tax=Lactococcus lactis TaxID=1358 RepID=A0A0V8DMZ0_LACLL|nr:hypothetical protein LMG9449_2328 [Lactococcus lactis subsp. lactis]